MDRPIKIVVRRRGSDVAFRTAIQLSGVLVLAIMLLVGWFLGRRALSGLNEVGWSFFTTEIFEPDSGRFGIAAVLPGTIMIALVAVAFALPLSTGSALYISEYTSGRSRRFLVSMVDLMAAVPSIVYGLWGAYLLQRYLLVNGPQGEGLPRWLSTYLSWIPIFKVDGVEPGQTIINATSFTASTFIAGLVVGLMVTPIACSIMREVFSQAPVGEREGALALGATRWGMIRSVVLPYGRGGIIGGIMLGLGRALGETIAVVMIISPVFYFQPHILQKGANSVSALIALRFGEATSAQISALMAAGLALFALTLLVNYAASMVINRSRSGAVSDA